METIDIRTAQNVVIVSDVAGIGDRVLAYLLDLCVMAAYLILVGFILAIADAGVAMFVLAGLPWLLYFPLTEILFDGQSVGKHLRGIRVTRLDGSEPSVGDHLLRWLLRMVDIWISSGVVALMAIILSGKGQRLGDIVAGTTVVRVRKRVSLNDTVLARLEETYEPVFPQAARMTGEEALVARDVLREYARDPDSEEIESVAERLRAILEQRLEIRSELATGPFLRTLLKDYNFYQGRL